MNHVLSQIRQNYLHPRNTQEEGYSRKFREQHFSVDIEFWLSDCNCPSLQPKLRQKG